MNHTTYPEWLQDLLRRWKAHDRGAQRAIAARHGVDDSMVSKVVSGEKRSLAIEESIAEQLGRWLATLVVRPAKFRMRGKKRVPSNPGSANGRA